MDDTQHDATANETPATFDSGDEAQTADEPVVLADEPDDDDDDDDDEQEPETETAAPRDEKEALAQRKKLDSEDERHARRVQEIVGEDAVHLLQCPLCMHFSSGWFFPPNVYPIPDEHAATAKVLLGVPLVPELREHPAFVKCPECDGHGEVLTGSNRSGYQTSNCPGCGSKGWRSLGEQQTRNGADVPGEPPPVLTGPTVTAAPDDPSIQALRERGFLVVPPTVSQAGG